VGLVTVVRNVMVHYVGAGLTFTGERLEEINNRWVERILDTDQGRHAAPLSAPRPETERVAGCCRDFTLLTVAALRHKGVPARSRIGFAGYFHPDFHEDHVVVDYWNGQRWVGDVPDIKPDAPPGQFGAFIMLPEGVGRLFSPAVKRSRHAAQCARKEQKKRRQQVGRGN